MVRLHLPGLGLTRGLLTGLLLTVTAGVAFSATDGSDFKAKSADHFEHTIDFMVTIALGAFAVLGYLLKDSILTPGCRRWSQLIVASLAMLAGAASLYFGYKSYLGLITVTASGTFSFGAMPETYAMQALFLLLEGLFIFLTLVITLLYREGNQHAPNP
jgi:hypothetical protein